MKNVQKGFTLIELMIVVAIIGILAAIAIPQYQDYIARTQMTRVYNEVSDLKTSVEEHLMRNAITTSAGVLGFTNSDLMDKGVPVITMTSKGVATITATMANKASTNVNGVTIELDRAGDGTWTCKVTSSANSNYKSDYTPSGC